MMTGPLADYLIRNHEGRSVEMPEAPEAPAPPLAQITLAEMSDTLERLEVADTALMRAILRGMVYERDVAAARIVRSMRGPA